MVLLPLLGIVSSYYDNRLLLLATFLIAAVTVFSAIGKSDEHVGKIRENYLILLIFSVGLTLLMSQSASSSFLQGGDIHQEYNVFSQVLAAGVWHPNAATIYNSVLSITVFPAVLKIVSGLDAMVIFTTIFPLIFAIAPVLLYKLCRTFLPPTESFLATFLFLAYHSFYVDLISEARQEIAEVLLLLLLLLLCSREVIGKRAGAVSVLMLTVGIVTAHYSIAYIYLGLLALWFLLGIAFRRMRSVKLSILALTATFTVLWYAFLTSGIDFVNLVNFVLSINLAEFFNPTSRPLVVNIALGAGALSGPLHLLSRMTYYLVNAALALGFLVVLFKRNKDDREREMLPILAFGVLFIGASVVIPNFGFGLNFARQYHIGLLLASPCFVYGVIFLNSKIRRLFSALFHVSLRVPAMRCAMKWRFWAATLLFLFFLFDSGWIWAVSLSNPTSVLLDSERIKHQGDPPAGVTFYGVYTSSKDVAAARWLSPQFGSAVSSLCADYWARNNVLTSYGGLTRANATIPTYFLPSLCDFRKGYVFLSELNTVYGVGIEVGESGGTKASQNNLQSSWPIAQISPELNSDNVIYSNGGTTIYNYPG